MPGAAYVHSSDAGQVFAPTPDGRSSANGKRGGKRGNKSGSNGKKKTVQQGMETTVQRTVYICDIDQQVTEEQLANVFADCGAVIDCRVCGDPNSAMRFAFIEFTTKESAAKVCMACVSNPCTPVLPGHQQNRHGAGPVPAARLALQNRHRARQQRLSASNGRRARAVQPDRVCCQHLPQS